MVPTLSLSASVELEHQKRTIRANAVAQPRQLAELACALSEQNAQLHSIIRKAAHRMSELEITQLLAPESDLAFRGPAFPRLPLPLRVMLWLYGYHLSEEPSSSSESQV